MNSTITIETLRETASRIKPYIHRTPVFCSTMVNQLCEAALYFKSENLQKVGAFKARGAVNAVFSLNDHAFSTNKKSDRYVTTHSSGNHAAALAYAARCRGIKALVVMPENAPPVKKAAVAGYGAQITYVESTQAAREMALAEIVEQTGAVFIHPYNDQQVIAGQATAAMELIEQVSGLDAVIAPVGGGGLLSGTALSVSAFQPSAQVFGAEPEGANDAFRSLQAGCIIPMIDPQTIADGLRTSLGEITFPIIQKHVKEIITVDEKSIIHAMRLIWERMKIIVEPSSAVVLAAVIKKRRHFKGKKIGLIISGGNADLDNIPWL